MIFFLLFSVFISDFRNHFKFSSIQCKIATVCFDSSSWISLRLHSIALNKFALLCQVDRKTFERPSAGKQTNAQWKTYCKYEKCTRNILKNAGYLSAKKVNRMVLNFLIKAYIMLDFDWKDMKLAFFETTWQTRQINQCLLVTQSNHIHFHIKIPFMQLMYAYSVSARCKCSQVLKCKWFEE